MEVKKTITFDKAIWDAYRDELARNRDEEETRTPEEIAYQAAVAAVTEDIEKMRFVKSRRTQPKLGATDVY